MTPKPEDANETMKIPREAVEWRYSDEKSTRALLHY